MNIMRFIVPKSLVEYVTVDSTIRQALEKMRFHRYAAIPVIDGEGKFVGTLRNDDLLRYFLERGGYDKRETERVGIETLLDQDSSRPLYHNASMSQLIEQVKEHNFVSVVDDRGCFIGIILRREILNYLLRFYKEEND